MNTTNPTRYHAHSGNPWNQWHPLPDHLRAVAALATSFAHGLPWEKEAGLAGLLHDLG
ncbi:MAG: hypothetical protein G8237_03845 [Magnetococcales bacterium]|nr:hypothetical protein [Magnetococcales bacterium]